mgnify:CR=1 FL=1
MKKKELEDALAEVLVLTVEDVVSTSIPAVENGEAE